MSNVTKQPTGPFNPFFGCAVMAIVALTLAGIAAFAWYSLRTQDTAIGKFTVDNPVTLSPTKVSDAEAAELQKTLAAFGEGVKAGKTGALELSIAELNTLLQLAPDSGYGKFTEMIAFKSTKPESNALVADVCLPMNKMIFQEGKRYAVGEAEFTPEIVKEAGADMKLTSLRVPGKEVHPQFVQALGGWHWLTPYQKLEAFTAIFKAITKVEVTATGVKLTVSKP